MSYSVLNLVSSRLCGGPTRKALLREMADKASDDGGGIFSSNATLAAVTEVGVSTVKRAIKSLEADGLIVREGERACVYGYTVVWRIDLRAIEALPPIASKAPKAAPKPPSADATPSNLNPVQIEPGPNAPPTPSNLNPHPVQIEPPTRSKLNHEPSPLNLIQEPNSRSSSLRSDDPVSGSLTRKRVELTLSPDDAPPSRAIRPKRSFTASPGPEFDAVWAAWPRKSEKAAAAAEWREWLKAVPANGLPPAGRIKAAAMAYLTDPATRRSIENGRETKRDPGAYIKALHRWLRDNLEIWIEKSHAADTAGSGEVWDGTQWVRRSERGLAL